MTLNCKVARMRRRCARWMRLTCALLVAAVVSWTEPRTALTKILAALRSWRYLSRRVDAKTMWRRYAACIRCPIFYKPLRTCGTPLTKELRGLGCYCNMEAKVLWEESTCWLEDNVGGRFKQWTKRINRSTQT